MCSATSPWSIRWRSRPQNQRRLTDPSADEAADALLLLETGRYLDDIALPLLRERMEIEEQIAALATVTGTPEYMAARVNR